MPDWESSVVLVKCYDGDSEDTCTGFVAKTKGTDCFVATCAHVEDGLTDARFSVDGIPASVISRPPYDLLLLQAELPEDKLGLALAVDEPNNGARVNIFGYTTMGDEAVGAPVGGSLKERIRRIPQNGSKAIGWHVDIDDGHAIGRGYSGSPIVSDDGRVLGILTHYDKSRNLGTAFGVSAIREATVGSGPKPSPLSAALGGRVSVAPQQNGGFLVELTSESENELVQALTEEGMEGDYSSAISEIIQSILNRSLF